MATRRLADGLQAQIGKDDAQKAMNRAMHIVERKSSMPAIGAVLIEGGKDQITVSAYDLEVGVNSRHGAEVKQTGRVLVPAKLLKAAIDRAPENVIELEALDHNRVRVLSGTMVAEIIGLAPSDFPEIPMPSSLSFAPTDSTALATLIAGVRDAMSTDETRFNLCGARLEKTRAGWRMVATDGHRLSVLERAIEEANRRAVDERVFLGGKTLDTMYAILMEDEATPGELGFNKSTCVFRRPGLDLISRLQEDSFPDWTQVVPKETEHVVAIPTAAFIDTLQRVQVIAGEVGDRIVLHLGKNILKLAAEAASAGMIADRLTCEHAGPDVTMAVNAKYMIQALKALGDAPQVNLGMDNSISPVTLRPVGDDSRAVWVIMPMRVEVAESKALETDDVEGVFPPMRKVWADQTTKAAHMEYAEKLGRDAARAARRDKGGPIEKDDLTWPVAGFWKAAEEFAKRAIPEDERARAREVFWQEAMKPWPVGEPTRAMLDEVEAMGKRDGEKMLKAMGGNRLTLADRRSKDHPPADFWPKLAKDLKRDLTDAERDAYQEAYYDACAVEDVGDEVPRPPVLRSVKDDHYTDPNDPKYGQPKEPAPGDLPAPDAE